MITRFSKRLRARRADEGIGLVEVLVALMVFTIIALGMGYSLMTTQRLAYDTENRETATNIGAEEIARLKAKGDVFHLYSTPDGTPDVVVRHGVKFYIDRSVDWNPTNGTVAACGTGGGNLLWKFVNLAITWDGMLMLKNPVRADTIIAPDDRVNDPDSGTIVVSVRGNGGTGRSGVGVSIRDKSSGSSIGAVDDTDPEGCSYALKVPAGTYTVKPSRSGYISTDPIAWANGTANAPSVDVKVDPGTTKSALFDYDAQNTFTLGWASNRPPGTVYLPKGMKSTFVTETGMYQRTETTPPSSVNLYPYTAGYSPIAGAYAPETDATPSCLSPDPAAWSAGTVGGTAKADGVRGDPVSADPGAGDTIAIPMGYVSVKIPGLTNTLTVQNVISSYPGDPGCEAPQTVTFSVPSSLLGSTVTIALPYGSWSIYAGTSTTSSARISGGGSLSVIGNPAGLTSGSIVTLDPRVNA